MRVFIGAVLCVSLAPLAAPAVGAASLSYPSPFSYFPVCSTADQEFCLETFEFTPKGGSTRVIADPTNPSNVGGRTDPYVNVFVSGTYSGTTTPLQGRRFFPALSINYYDPVGSIWSTPVKPKTLAGLADGTYRTVLRTGDYDPSFLMLTGKYSSYTVTKGSDGNFTVDLSATPTSIASVVKLDGDSSALDACRAGKWVTNCESNQAYRGYILASFVMAEDSARREAARGTWISTNASSFSLDEVNFATGRFDVTAEGPHYVPLDFGVPGLTPENGRELNPAYFEMSVPLTTVAKMMSQISGKEVTVEIARKLLADPSKIFEGTIEDASSGQVAEKAQQLTMTLGENALRVNFNLTHYSAPNPTLSVKASSANQTLTVLLSNSGASTSTPSDSATTKTTTSSVAKITKRSTTAVITVTMARAGTIKFYRKLKGKITLVRTLKAKTGANKVTLPYAKGAVFTVRSSTGKIIATLK